MTAEKFVSQIQAFGIKNFIGVPDSTLKVFCDYLNRQETKEIKHYVPVNEGAAVGMAIGNYLATGIPSCVYMQNSGLGNVVNPITSLANEEVYGIPMLMLVGWRGEPGKKDEPQHKFMGKVTEEMLEILGIEHAVLGRDTEAQELQAAFEKAGRALKESRQFAFVIKRDFFEEEEMKSYQNNNGIVREDAIKEIIKNLSKEDVLVSTTGKISREVYEQSDAIKGQHAQDFLTVGGMGHTSMIALGIAEERQEKNVYCLDGDGAVLMHMGSLAFIGNQQPNNFVHICLNNDAHESVGGMPTGCVGKQYAQIAEKCGYAATYVVDKLEDLQQVLEKVRKEKKLSFVEVKVAMKSRADLGRPKETAEENKENFMKYHGVKKL